MELLFGDGLRRIVQQYIFSRNVDEQNAMTMAELMDLVKAEGDEAVHQVAQAVLSGFHRYDPQDEERARRKAEADAFYQALQGIEPGIPEDAPSFEDPFEFTSPTVREAFHATREWALGMGPGLLALAGPPGVGKTHLAKAASRKVRDLGRTVVWRIESRLLREIQECMNRGSSGAMTVKQMQDEFESVPWLVIDEFGGAPTGNWGSGVMDDLVNARWDNSGLRTLLTSNLTSAEMPVRIASRLKDGARARAIVIRADDYRTGRTWQQGGRP